MFRLSSQSNAYSFNMKYTIFDKLMNMLCHAWNGLIRLDYLAAAHFGRRAMLTLLFLDLFDTFDQEYIKILRRQFTPVLIHELFGENNNCELIS